MRFFFKPTLFLLTLVAIFLTVFFFKPKSVEAGISGCLEGWVDVPTRKDLPSVGDKLTANMKLKNIGCSPTDLIVTTGVPIGFNMKWSIQGNNTFFDPPEETRVLTVKLKTGQTITVGFTTTIKSGNTCATSGHVEATGIFGVPFGSITSAGTASTNGGIGAVLNGTVYRWNGTPAAFASVSISPVDASAGTVTANGSGVYTLRRLNCNLGHSVTASEGGVSASIWIANTAGGGNICNGQVRSNNIQLPRPNQPPQGSHDNSDCNVTTGWAWDPDSPSVSISVHIYRDGPAGGGGVFMAAVTANIFRSDVQAVTHDNGLHGFSWPTPPELKDGFNHSIYVYAIDTAGGSNPLLSQSPKTINCPVLINGYKVNMPGNVARPAGDTVWLDAGSPSDSGNFYRLFTTAGSHTVHVSIPPATSLLGYTLCINSTTCHGNPPSTVGLSFPSGSEAVVTVTVPAGGIADLWWHYSRWPQGFLDTANCGEIAGWAWDPDSPDVSIDVHIYDGQAGAGGVIMAAVTADIFRSDVQAVTGDNGLHGFSWDPVDLLDGEEHQIWVYGIDTAGGNNPPLANSGKKIKCKGPWIQIVNGGVGAVGSITMVRDPAPAAFNATYEIIFNGTLKNFTSQSNWYVDDGPELPLFSLVNSSYEELLAKYGKEAQDLGDPCKDEDIGTGAGKIYHCKKEMKINKVTDSPDTCQGLEPTYKPNVIFVEKDLEIHRDYKPDKRCDIFIVKKEIKIKKRVTDIRAFLIADSINTHFETPPEKDRRANQLLITGGLVTFNNPNFARKLPGEQNETDPAEKIIFNPLYIHQANAAIAQPVYVWEEVSP